MSTPNDNFTFNGLTDADSVAQAEAALAQEKANQEKIGATVQAARASDTQADFWHKQASERGAKIAQLQAQRDELQARTDKLLAVCRDLLGACVWIRDVVKRRKETAYWLQMVEDKARNAIARATEGGRGQ